MMMSEKNDKRVRPPVSTYLLASDFEGRQIVSIHSKLTYTLLPTGKCLLADLQMPLLLGPLPCEEGEEPFHETDILSFKGSTDVIVLASAYGNGKRTMEARIRVADRDLKYLVMGERKAMYRGKGSVAFSKPEPFDTIPLRYEYAYGGFDETVPEAEVTYLIDLFRAHPGLYPRNPVGRGYIVHENRAAIDGRLLPNVENPSDLLTPDRLITGEPENWWKQPLPWSCDWFDKSWYPRIAHYRGVPDGLPDNDNMVPEVRFGWVDPGQNQWVKQSIEERPLDGRLADAASPSLVLPFLRGNEAVELSGMTREGRIVVQLPNKRPMMRLCFEGKAYMIRPVPHRILISLEEMGVYVVWHGAWHPPRLLPDRLPTIDDPPMFELQGINVEVDEQRIQPLDEAENEFS